MFVDLSAPSRLSVAGILCVLALAHALPAWAQSDKVQQLKTPVKTKATSTAKTTELLDGQAETRLLAVYKLVADGRHHEALAQADRLVHDYPNFQLAQLALGDLLMARTRPASKSAPPTPTPAPADNAEVQTALQDLRTESRLRVEAQRNRPPAHSIPAQFLELPVQSRHAIAVDASRSRLYFFQNSAKGLQLIGDYYASVGKLGLEKHLEGDQRTPLGVYFITSRLDPSTLKDFYGVGALPINYPNPLDQSRGKTGSGIWLHGTPTEQFSRAPLATDGCLVLSNQDLDRVLRTVEPRTTPVVIARQLQWVTPRSLQAQRQSFDDILNAWSQAKSEGDMKRLMGFYAADFQTYRIKGLDEWNHVLQAEAKALRGRKLQLKEKSFLQWTDTSDTMVVTFGEVAEGARTGPVKRQYWTRKGQHWQIFFEGVIG
jgi:murein L,D-transpeptidase YafK